MAVWLRRPAAVAAFTHEHGGAAATDLRDLLGNPAVDVVYVATLPDSHARYSIAALESGKAVLCEKPAAISGAVLETILAVAKDRGRLWMEALKPPFFPLYTQVEQLLRTDPIGSVQFVRAGSSLANVDPSHPSFRPDCGGGALLQIGVYGAFLATAWLGPATSVQATGRIGTTGVDVFAAVQAAHGGDASSQTYCGLDLAGPGEALLCATQGHVIIHAPWWNPEAATVCHADGRRVDVRSPFLHGGLYHEIVHVCGLVRRGETESDVMSHTRSRQIASMLDQARASLRPDQAAPQMLHGWGGLSWRETHATTRLWASLMALLAVAVAYLISYRI